MEKENSSFKDIKELLNVNVFKGKVLLLTGGTSKMLYQIALDFMKLGGHVALVSRRKKELDEIALELSKLTGNKAKGYELNLKNPELYEGVVDDVIKDFGRIDVLVNGAAGNFLAFAENLSYNAFKTVLEIDTLSTFYMSKIVYKKYMKENGGSIINITANLHHLGTLMNSHASAAKAGVDAITKTLALEWGPYGVRVNGVSPGFIDKTEGLERLSNPKDGDKENSKKLIEKYQRMLPAQRLGDRIDVSNAVLFLACDLSSYITGQTIEVDGGQKAILPNFMIYYPGFEKMWLKPRTKF